MPTLDWLNREAAFKIAKDVPYRLLETVSEHHASEAVTAAALASRSSAENMVGQSSLDLEAPEPPPEVPAPTHDNLLIQGDNLEALKALLPF